MKLTNLYFSAAVFTLSVSAIAAPKPHPLGFESSEHIFIGDQVVLQGLPVPSDKEPVKLTIANGLQLTYGDIISMPDYYGEPKHQISSEVTFEARKAQFAKIYDEFSHYSVNYFHAFWPILQEEQQQIASAIKSGQSVPVAYRKMMDKEMIRLEIATHFRFLSLAEYCFDHFSTDAWLAYQAGHSVAIDTAISGHQIADGLDHQANAQCAQIGNVNHCLMIKAQDKLELAYAENAYANHFLTDRLAAGHMRTPFRALHMTRPIGALGGVAGSYMHNEDNAFGVIVTNNSGKNWMAYGDDYYFTKQNSYHRKEIKAIVQASADQVYQAFKSGYNPDYLSQQLYAMLPKPIAAGKKVMVEGVGVEAQTSPLYQLVAGAVWEREDINNRYDNHWVQNWSTLKLLKNYHVKLPS